MAGGRWRKSASLAASAVVLLATAVLLDLFARHEFTAHLRDQAAYAMALAATGRTPYEWRFHGPDDLVAGHPFGTERFDFADGALRLPSAPGDVEVGLPLTRPIDLRCYSLLRPAFEARTPGTLRVVARETLEAPERISEPVAFAAGEFREALELQSLGWTEGPAAAVAPRTAAMLRIRFAAKTGVLLRGALLQRPSGYSPLNLASTPRPLDASSAPRDGTAVYRLPLAPAQQQMDIATIAANWKPPQPPLILLPQRGRVEQQIALRNAVYRVLPSAILIPEGAYDRTFAQAREYAATRLKPAAPGTSWFVVAAYALVLLAVRWRPPRDARLRAMAEIALTLAAPMWLVVSGRIDGSTLHAPQTVLIGFSLIYAVSLSLHPSWQLNGNSAAWIAAGIVVVVAILIGLAVRATAGSGIAVPGFRHFSMYLGWALLQQFLICAVCTERWRIVTGNAPAAAWLGALCFALLHTPNATLMLATFAGGLCWCAIWLRHRALLPLAFSHAASALALSALLPPEVLHSAEVSVRFFQ